MSELKFKQTKSDNFAGKEIAEGDLIAYNTQLGEASPAEVENKLGSTYRGQHIIGTTEAKKLCLNEDIKVMGVTVGNLKDGITLSKGDDLQTILQKILCKTIDVKAQAPTAALTPTGTTNYEYGSTVPATTFTVTFNQGKFVSAESGWTSNQAMDCALQSVNIDGEAAAVSGNSATYTLPAFTLTATKTVTAGPATFSANTVVPKKNDNTASDVTYTGTSVAVSGSKSFVPQYKYFFGFVPNNTVLSSAIVRALEKSANISMTPANVTIVGSTVQQDKAKHDTIIACPPGYKLVSIQDSMTEVDVSSTFATENVDITCGSEVVTYKVYRGSNLTYNVNSYVNIVIGKA